ncbi:MULTISPECIES: amino acid permease [Deefgea]|uniref:Serine transporter n=1 Tax=Deefgea chitinilytica TaxID=570276 RepID=A0ABS2C9G6_9NEIS|nr:MULTISPECIES: aromatic amino acid transport family protein [Deefgea]MBM5570667.1 serine transporter [Deefgea chitinilytica]MBM9887896.1 serine transporter [Deefgea sp. CFH1-16]
MSLDRKDWEWVLTCFGTAVGAGILYLPIRAGMGGIWPMLILTLIIFPVTYIAHRGITRVVASCPKPTDIVGAVEHDLGRNVGFAVSILYFLSIVTICVGYATGVTNIVASFLHNQLGIEGFSRTLLTFLLLAGLTGVILAGEKFMVRVTSLMTFPLIIMLAALSIYMIPQWNLSVLHVPFASADVLKNLLLLFPVLVFAMNFSPVCSTLAASYRAQYSAREAVARTDGIIKWTSLILLVFVMFFVFSMVLATSPEVLAASQAQNIDILTTMSLIVSQPFLRYLIPVIAFLAIASSYFGHFVGTREGLVGITTRVMTWNNPAAEVKLNRKKINLVVTLVMMVGLWFLAVYNPPILKIIGALSAPVIAIYAYLMPVMLMKRIPRLTIYQSRTAGFIFVMGLVGIVGDFVGSYL